MLRSKLFLAGAVVVVGLGTATATSEAAWWNFGRNGQSEANRGGAVQLAQSAEADRLNRIEAQMRELTGQIEELTFQLRQLQDQLQHVQEDADYRFRTLEGDGAPPRQVGDVAPVVPPTDDTIGTIAGQPEDTVGDDGVVLGAPPQPLGTLVLDAEPAAGGQPLDLSALAGGDAADNADAAASIGVETAPSDAAPQQVVAVQPTGDPRTDYNRAYNLIVAGNFDLAEQSFRQFLATYPGDEAAPDAQYWLGESFFARGRFGDAAEAFRAGYKAYPESSRAPDTLLKLGLSLAGLGERDAACQIYAQVLKQYTDMSNALRQRVVTEQASARC